MPELLDALLDPLRAPFFVRALLGGALAAALCALAGSWVVARGMAFLGEALAHGLLPGVALAALLGLPLPLGAAVGAAVMSLGVTAVTRRARLGSDTAIGILFAGMLALGVLIVSTSRSFAVELTSILFGDILAIRPAELVVLAIALGLALGVLAVGHRAFVSLALDERIARTTGMRPRLAHAALVGLVTLAVVAAYQSVGSLLVVGLLLAPAATARLLVVRLVPSMALAVALGVAAVLVGLLASWHLDLAAGAAITAVAVGMFLLTLIARSLPSPRRARRRAATAAVAMTAASALLLAGCAPAAAPGDRTASATATDPGSALGDGHGRVAGASELADPPTSLAWIDTDGVVRLRDLVTDEVERIAEVAPPQRLESDGRFLYAMRPGVVEIVDTGVWTRPHGDHVHYYRAEPRRVGAIRATTGRDAGLAELGHSDGRAALLFSGTGEVVVLERAALGEGEVDAVLRGDPDSLPALGEAPSAVVPLDGGLAVGDAASGTVRVLGDDGETASSDDTGGSTTGAAAPCPGPSAAATSRPGAVIACADGAVIVTGAAAEATATHVPSTASATTLASRHDRAALAGPTADGTAIAVLDVRAATWAAHPLTGRAITATAVDDADEHVIATLDDGALVVLDGTGAEVSRTAPLVSASAAGVGSAGSPGASPPRLDVDTDRAYLVGSAEGRVWEVDYRDGARIAREFEIGVGSLAAEVGR